MEGSNEINLQGSPYEAVAAGVIVQDADGIVIDANTAACEILGFAKDQILGYGPSHPMWCVAREDGTPLTPDEQPAAIACRTGQPVKDFALCIHDQTRNTPRWMLVSSQPILDPTSGKPCQVVSTFLDITERKTTEDRLKLTQFFIDNASDDVYWVSPEGKLVYVNNATCRSLGYTRDEFLTMTIPDFAPTMTKERWPHRWQIVQQQGSVRFEARHKTRDGRVFPVEIVATHVQFGSKEYMLAFGRDISERKKAEEAIRDARERMAVLMESAPFGIHVHELQPDGRLIFAAANPAASQMLGMDCSKLLGKETEKAFPGLVGTDIPALYRRVAAEGIRHEQEEVPYNHGKIKGVFQISAFQSAPNTVAIFFRDITEVSRAKAARRRFEKHVENQKRQFYRETILSVTQGKLEICDPRQVKPYISNAQLRIDVRNSSAVPESRHEVEKFCRGCGLDADRLDAFMLGVGEAIANAIKHAVKGRVYAGSTGDSVWAGVSDKGSGIESLVLSQAVLRKGYSTKPSLGLGYSIMLDVADRILLQTDERGTTVILEKQIQHPQIAFSLANIPDTW